MKIKHTIGTSLFILMLLAVFSASAFAQTVINQNGDFSEATEGQTSDITNWLLEGTDNANFEVVADPDDPENLVLQVTLTDIEGINAWTVQALNTGTIFSAGEDYEISFRVRGDQDGTVQLDAQSGAQLWGQQIYGGEWHTLETGVFIPDEDGERLIAVHFAHENNEDGFVFYIDDIQVIHNESNDNGDDEDESFAPNPPHAIGDIINYNGSFQHSELGENEPIAWTVSTNAGSEAMVVNDSIDDDDRAFEFNVEWTGNTNWWENEVVNEPIHVLEGDILQISVWLKADTEDRIARVYLGMPESGGWERARGWDTPELTLSEEWQEFTFKHTVTANNATHGMRTGIEFNSQVNDGAIIYIDNLQVEKIGIGEAQQRVPVIVEAESGELGNEWDVIDEDGTTYIVISTDFAETSGTTAYPGENRTASYSVSFPAEGEYDLFARVRVGPQDFDDDSFFEPHGFGEKDPSNPDDWFNVNGLAAAGYDDPDAVVRDAGGLGSNVWKWVNISRNAFQGDTTQTFIVEGDLTKTFQIGAREDGQDIDKFVFGRSDLYFTVANLDNLEAGSETDPRDIPAHTTPIADGKEKWLGNIYSSSQIEDFEVYWNQVTPENAGKWGSVESTRGEYNWGELDASYDLAKDNGFPFRFHVLVWGGQQPGWINDLSTEEQLVAITEWFDAVAERYPDMEYVEVVNEGSNNHQLPDGQSGDANYIEALGGTGETGHDWIITSFEMARERFPDSKLMINDYNIVSSTNNTLNYLQIINDLNDRGLIDVIGVQGHAFSTRGPVASIEANLDRLAETGLPIQVTEFDIDGDPSGSNEESDQTQLEDMQRIFPALWEHPAVEGITLWGWRPGMWRQDQDAFLIRSSGVERPALTWLREYVEETDLSVSNEIVDGESPIQFKLYSNFPNPFNPTTQIRYDIAHSTDVSVRVYDVLGRQVQTLVNKQQSPGTYTVTFDASNLSSGVYFYRIQTDFFVDVKQMMLVK